jgi:hypothetical protein
MMLLPMSTRAGQRPNPVAAAAALVGAMLLIVSPFLVWGKVGVDLGIVSGSVSQTGMDSGYGWITIVLGVAVAGLLMAWAAGVPRRWVRAGWLVLGVGAAALTVYELAQVHDCALDLFDECAATPDWGPGLFVALAGAVATVIAAGLGRIGRGTTG